MNKTALQKNDSCDWIERERERLSTCKNIQTEHSM